MFRSSKINGIAESRPLNVEQSCWEMASRQQRIEEPGHPFEKPNCRFRSRKVKANVLWLPEKLSRNSMLFLLSSKQPYTLLDTPRHKLPGRRYVKNKLFLCGYLIVWTHTTLYPLYILFRLLQLNERLF